MEGAVGEGEGGPGQGGAGVQQDETEPAAGGTKFVICCCLVQLHSFTDFYRDKTKPLLMLLKLLLLLLLLQLWYCCCCCSCRSIANLFVVLILAMLRTGTGPNFSVIEFSRVWARAWIELVHKQSTLSRQRICRRA